MDGWVRNTAGVVLISMPLLQEEYSRIDLTVVCADGSQVVIPGAPAVRMQAQPHLIMRFCSAHLLPGWLSLTASCLWSRRPFAAGCLCMKLVLSCRRSEQNSAASGMRSGWLGVRGCHFVGRCGVAGVHMRIKFVCVVRWCSGGEVWQDAAADGRRDGEPIQDGLQPRAAQGRCQHRHQPGARCR